MMPSSETASPTVSVVMPTFNRARFLHAAVASIRAQTYRCLEIVIVDDGSTDDTAAVAAALGDEVRYVRQPNAGPAAARNRGIADANGELIAFLDTDDRWLPTKIERQVAVLRRDPAIALVSADMAVEDGDGRRLVESNFERRGLRQFFAELDGGPVPEAPRRLLQVNFINTSTVMVRREVLQATHGFDTRLRYGEDLELWLRIAARHAIACVPTVEEIRVEHETNVTRSIEPMLIGYVRLAEVLREWARDLMPGWGTSANRYVADCLNDLGYWYFSRNRFDDARRVLGQSLRESVSARALLYAAAARMPVPLIEFIRRTKSTTDIAADDVRQ
jgi:glycosyltransferase involved in cell wall biosynthesis